MYLRALATLPHVSIHLGHFLTKSTTMPLANPQPTGPKFAEVLKPEEKGSDVNLATYLLADSFRQDADAFVIVSKRQRPQAAAAAAAAEVHGEGCGRTRNTNRRGAELSVGGTSKTTRDTA